MVILETAELCVALASLFELAFVLLEFLLGLTEGGLFPGINLLLTHWYTRDESNWAVGIFFAGATLAGAWGGACLIDTPQR